MRHGSHKPTPNWQADITFIPTHEGWLYLVGVLDCCSRNLVGWSMEVMMTAQLGSDALDLASQRRRPTEGLLHHSDRGCQYAYQTYQSRLSAHGNACDMSRTGNCYDIVMKESFRSSLKRAASAHRVLETIEQARAVMFEYIEVIYNRKPRYSSLGSIRRETFEAALN